MSCANCGPEPSNCCCGGGKGHCNSSCYESSCTDEGQGFPMSIIVSCQAPIYTPIPGVVGVWDGEQWLLDTDSSSE